MQTELFQELPAASHPERLKSPLFPHRFLRVRVAHEDLIFWSLSLLLLLLAGFCLGVERGKRLGTPAMVVAADSTVAPLVAEEVLPVLSVARPIEPSKKLLLSGSAAPGREVPLERGVYALQLASFLDESSAQKEAIRLKRQGFKAQVVKQGRYFELRVVGFRSRQEAVLSLSKLKKTYRDGFVKRVESKRA